MIEVKNLSKRYGGFSAIEDVSFKVAKGEIVGFLGPNGAGKTTTMRILTCFMPPTSGSASVAGFDCSSQPLEVRRRLGYLPESAPLYGEMKVAEFLGFVASVRGLRGTAKLAKVGEAMERTGIIEVGGRLIEKLSKGYRQRVALAQALLNDPEVLVLDEPTVGLDPKQIVEIRRLIKGLGGKSTVILSTHILPEVSIVCDRVVIIHKGRVVAEDTPSNLIAHAGRSSSVLVTAEGDPDGIERALVGVTGVKSVRRVETTGEGKHLFSVETGGADLRRELSSAIVQGGWGLLEIAEQRLSLEEVFVELTAGEETKDV